jgi:hypothetical protein
MKTLQKYVGVNSEDFETLVPTITAASTRMFKDYQQYTHPKLKMLDALIILSIVSAVIQIVYAYGIVFDRDPFNSYLSGLFCSIGQFALAGMYPTMS